MSRSSFTPSGLIANRAVAHLPSIGIGGLSTAPLQLSALLRLWLGRSRQRRALYEIAERADYLLKDIGVSQQEAFREAEKPCWRR